MGHLISFFFLSCEGKTVVITKGGVWRLSSHLLTTPVENGSFWWEPECMSMSYLTRRHWALYLIFLKWFCSFPDPEDPGCLYWSIKLFFCFFWVFFLSVSFLESSSIPLFSWSSLFIYWSWQLFLTTLLTSKPVGGSCWVTPFCIWPS